MKGTHSGKLSALTAGRYFLPLDNSHSFENHGSCYMLTSTAYTFLQPVPWETTLWNKDWHSTLERVKTCFCFCCTLACFVFRLIHRGGSDYMYKSSSYSTFSLISIENRVVILGPWFILYLSCLVLTTTTRHWHCARNRQNWVWFTGILVLQGPLPRHYLTSLFTNGGHELCYDSFSWLINRETWISFSFLYAILVFLFDI